jgi:photosystem II stability/assembly factor-like uncharacterized protein
VTLLFKGGGETELASLVLWPELPNLVLTGGSVSVSGNQNKLILKSTDGGITWNASDEGLPEQCRVEELAVDPLHDGVVLAATTAGLFSSTDYGSTWAAIALPAGDESVKSLVFDPGSPTLAFLGTAKGNILTSTDSGRTWAVFEPSLPFRGAITEILVISPRSKRILIGTENNSVWEITQGTGHSLRDSRRPRLSAK